jgi:hypothetical protein
MSGQECIMPLTHMRKNFSFPFYSTISYNKTETHYSFRLYFAEILVIKNV